MTSSPTANRRHVLYEAAARLLSAQRDTVPCAPVRDLLGSTDVPAAYAVQRRVIDHTLRAGRRRVGRKIGLTSPAVQAQLGVDQPDFGMLLDHMDRSASGVVDTTTLLQPRIEAEVAFVLSGDLDSDDLSSATLRGRISHAVAALEIVDSRIRDWDITIVDTVADNASSGAFVLGDRQVSLDELDLPSIAMTLTRNGEVVSTGTGTACLGDPLNAVKWLARTARQLGDPLRAGELVLSGALGPMVPVGPGDEIAAAISGFGSVRASMRTGTTPPGEEKA